MDADALRVVDDLIKKSLDDEWQRKASMEQRAFGVVTANLALVTLFLAIAAALDATGVIQKGMAGSVALTGLILAGGSILCAVLALLPRNFPTPSSAGVDRLLQDVVQRSLSASAASTQIAETRAKMLAAAMKATDRAGQLTFYSFLFLLFSALALIFSLGTVIGS